MNFFDFISDPILAISKWLFELLNGWGVPADWSNFILYFIGAALLGTSALLLTFNFHMG